MSSKEYKLGFPIEEGSIASVQTGIEEPLRPYTEEEIAILDMGMLESMRRNGILGDDNVLDVSDRMPFGTSIEVRKLLDIQPEEELDTDHS